jgi:hypothetical protein
MSGWSGIGFNPRRTCSIGCSRVSEASVREFIRHVAGERAQSSGTLSPTSVVLGRLWFNRGVRTRFELFGEEIRLWEPETRVLMGIRRCAVSAQGGVNGNVRAHSSGDTFAERDRETQSQWPPLAMVSGESNGNPQRESFERAWVDRCFCRERHVVDRWVHQTAGVCTTVRRDHWSADNTPPAAISSRSSSVAANARWAAASNFSRH